MAEPFRKTLPKRGNLVGKARISVAEQIYFQVAGQDPVSRGTPFTRHCESTEQPYVRHTSVGKDWTPVECGWLTDNVGMLHIENDEDPPPPDVPEKNQTLPLILEVAVAAKGLVQDEGADWTVPPGESMRGNPCRTLYVRCPNGTCRYTVTVFPR